jgi:hypothetical protein|tara:strand:- start:43 stop:228 length:186 start_codon:yes stop_codon:yes gene_type:complete
MNETIKYIAITIFLFSLAVAGFLYVAQDQDVATIDWLRVFILYGTVVPVIAWITYCFLRRN